MDTETERERQILARRSGSVALCLSRVLLVAALVAASAGTASARQAPAAVGLEQGLATFDEVVRIVAETHFDPGFDADGWRRAAAERRSRAEAAASKEELRAVIRELLDGLGQSHFSLWPGEDVDAIERVRAAGSGGAGHVGLTVALVDGELLVAEVGADGPAAAAGVGPGWALQTIDDIALDEQLRELRRRVGQQELFIEAQRMVGALLAGEIGSSAQMVFSDARRLPVSLTLPRVRRPGRTLKFGNLPPLHASLESERRRVEGAEVGIIAFNIWLPPLAAEFDRAVDEVRDADGVIIDLRGNPGGVGGMVMGIAGHFLDEPVSLGTMRSRDGELRYVANPRRVDGSGQRVEPFAGPLAIVIDGATASTSEVFAGGMQALGRARIFGGRSVGAVLPSLMERLANGDVLQHAIADFVTPAGERLEGKGVVPDELVPLSRESLLAGRDAPLEAALDWITRGGHGR